MLYQGQTLSLVLHDGGIAELTLDNQSAAVNKFDSVAVTELAQALDVLERSEGVAALLIASAKPMFVVGADILEFTSAFEKGSDYVKDYLRRNAENLNRIEDLSVPSIAAINGYALGGGFELALACDARIVAKGAVVGLPETTLGIMPGWGGTVRLTRLVGVEQALDWMCSGKQVSAEKAFKVGAADAVCEPDQLRDKAIEWLNEAVLAEQLFRGPKLRKSSPMQLTESAKKAFESAKKQFASPYYPAPGMVIDAVKQSAELPRDAALQVELDAFGPLSQTYQARALVGVFVNDQLVGKKAKLQSKGAAAVAMSGVLGAGIMGGGIAYQSALKGTPVLMRDIAQAGLDLGMKEAEKLLSKRVARGQFDEEQKQQILADIHPTLAFDGFEKANIVIEAVVENEGVKKQVLKEAERKVSPDAVLASNTSTISITELATVLERPQLFCGMHFFNPVHAMPLVEVIEGKQTAPETIATTVAYALALGKKPVVVKDCPGFLVNRVLFPYFAGFSLLMRDGASFEQVDRVMEAWGWPMGPAYLLDVVGLDTTVHAESVLAQGYPDRMAKSFATCTDALFKAGRLGQKTGAGYYEYSRDEQGRSVKEASQEALSLFESCVDAPRDFSEDEIIARMMLPLATELARCLEEGVVASPAEADMALLYGLGFPRFRGGVFRWIDETGLDKLAAMAEPYVTFGPLYQLTPGMLQRLSEGARYY